MLSVRRRGGRVLRNHLLGLALSTWLVALWSGIPSGREGNDPLPDATSWVLAAADALAARLDAVTG